MGFLTHRARVHVSTPWSVFQDGPDRTPSCQHPADADPEGLKRPSVPRSHQQVEAAGASPKPLSPPSKSDADQPPERIHAGPIKTGFMPGAHPRRPISFPPNNFRHYFTLSSKFFSSFPRGTCSLSVSRHYLALDGTSPPALGCNPKQPDSSIPPREAAATSRPTGLSPSTDASFPGGLGRGLGAESTDL